MSHRLKDIKNQSFPFGFPINKDIKLNTVRRKGAKDDKNIIEEVLQSREE